MQHAYMHTCMHTRHNDIRKQKLSFQKIHGYERRTSTHLTQIGERRLVCFG